MSTYHVYSDDIELVLTKRSGEFSQELSFLDLGEEIMVDINVEGDRYKFFFPARLSREIVRFLSRKVKIDD